MKRLTEKQLDKVFAAKLEGSSEFRNWFLGRTKFAGLTATMLMCRSDHPWYTSRKTGIQSETDILAVFADIKTQARFAIHIENKTWTGKFGPGQPELYHERARDWIGLPKYYSYTDYEAVLIAPLSFFEFNKEKSAVFDKYVSYEEIAESPVNNPLFRRSAV
jgi:hypothetical protein